MLLDRFDLPVATREPTTIASLDRFAKEVLSHGKAANTILTGTEADPGCALSLAYAAALYLFLQTTEGRARATPYLDRAKEAARRSTERERLVVAAMDAWWRGDIAAALDRHVEICRRYPRDLLNAKLAQIHQLNLGDRLGMRDLSQHALAANRDVGFAWSLAAFGFEQCGDAARAEAYGRRAVQMNGDDPWAHHAVAHVLASAGRLEEGIAWMEQWSARWQRCSSFMYTHNWWHTALFHMELGQYDRAVNLFQTRVWGVRKTNVQDQVNAISLLARLELSGVVGSEACWRDIAAHVRPRIHDRQNGFLDLHFVYALARAGDSEGVAEMLDSLDRHAASSDAASMVWTRIAATAARGLAAHAEGRASRAAALLGPIRHRLYELGGSTIQQDWFERIFLDCLARAEIGRHVSARRNANGTHRWLADRWGASDTDGELGSAVAHAVRAIGSVIVPAPEVAS